MPNEAPTLRGSLVTYVLLDELADAAKLEPRPTQIWILLTMEITVHTSDGDYLIAKQPYYADAEDPKSEFEGAWAPPFIGVPVPQRWDAAGSADTLKRRIAEVDASVNAVELVEQFLYEMGVENPSIMERPPFTELKSSPRNPSLVKAYKIRRFAVYSDLSTTKSNLADPDGRKGFVYIPLDQMDRYLQRSYRGDKAPDWKYLGLPLMTNIATLLSRPAELLALKSRPVNISPEYFFHAREGWLINFDLSGYGRAVQHVANHMQSLEESGPELADFFRARLAQWFAEFLAASGARQVQHAGDGFLCAVSSGADALDSVVGELQQLQSRIDGISRALPEECMLGSRTAVFHGVYKYGRVGGALSSVPGFDGENVVTVVRMEQGLAHLIKSGELREFGHGNRHFIVTLSEENSIDEALRNKGWHHRSQPTRLESKEFGTEGWVWARSIAE